MQECKLARLRKNKAANREAVASLTGRDKTLYTKARKLRRSFKLATKVK